MSIVSVLELLPLIGVIGLFVLPKGSTTLVKQFAIGVSVVDLAISIVMALRFNRGVSAMQFVESRNWISSFGIKYAVGIDGIARSR